MIRFLLDKYRTMPGPLKQARVVTADLAAELLDLAECYLKQRRNQDGDPPGTPCRSSDPPPEAPPMEELRPATRPATPPPAKAPPEPAEPAKARKKKSRTPATELEPPKALVSAIAIPSNLRRQDFKILAILWDAGGRALNPMSAKGISQHGTKLGIKIRHENVRKVIRSKLEKFVTVHTEVVGSGAVYRYEINSAGRQHFEETYLQST